MAALAHPGVSTKANGNQQTWRRPLKFARDRSGYFVNVRLPVYLRLAGEASARIIPRTALTSRDDQTALVKIERTVF